MAITLTGALALKKFADHHGLSGEWVKSTLVALPPAWKIKLKDEKLLICDAFGEAKTSVFWKHATAVNDLAKTIAGADLNDPANNINAAAPYGMLKGAEALAKMLYEGLAGAQRIKWLQDNMPPGHEIGLTKTVLFLHDSGKQVAFSTKKEPGCVDKLVFAIKAMLATAPVTKSPAPEIFTNADFAEGGYKATVGAMAVNALVVEKIINGHTAGKIMDVMNAKTGYAIATEAMVVKVALPTNDGKNKLVVISKQDAGAGAQIAACFNSAPSQNLEDYAKSYGMVAPKHSKIASANEIATTQNEQLSKESDPAKQLDTFVANSAMAMLTGKVAPAATKSKTVQVGSAVDYPVLDFDQMKSLTPMLLGAASGLYRPVRGSTETSRYFLVADMGGLKLAARIKDNKLSLRVEGSDFSKWSSTLAALGLDVLANYASTHVILSSTGLKDFIDAKRAVAALVAGLDMPVLSPPPDLQLILGKGA